MPIFLCSPSSIPYSRSWTKDENTFRLYSWSLTTWSTWLPKSQNSPVPLPWPDLVLEPLWLPSPAPTVQSSGLPGHGARVGVCCWDQQSAIRNKMISDETNCLLYRVSGFSIPSWLTCWVHERPAVLSDTFQRAEDFEQLVPWTTSLE